MTDTYVLTERTIDESKFEQNGQKIYYTDPTSTNIIGVYSTWENAKTGAQVYSDGFCDSDEDTKPIEWNTDDLANYASIGAYVRQYGYVTELVIRYLPLQTGPSIRSLRERQDMRLGR